MTIGDQTIVRNPLLASAIRRFGTVWRVQLAPAFGRFWRWWTGELLVVVPKPILERLTRAGTPLILLVGSDGSGRLFREAGGRRQLVEEMTLDAPVPSKEANTQTLRLMLDPELGLRTLTTLPLLAERNLEQAVSFEIERCTPFRRERVYHAYRVVGRDHAAQRIAVDLTVVPRPVLDATLTAVRSAGWQVEAACLAGSDAEAPSPNLLAPEHAPTRWRGASVVIAGLAVLASILAVTTVMVPLYQLHASADQLETTLETDRPQIEESRKLEKEIASRTIAGGFLAGKRAAAIPVSQLLLDITRLLPDDTWLTEFEMSGSTLQLTGLSQSASSALSLLDRSPEFSSPHFLSPVVQDPTSGRERFALAAQIMPGKSP